MSTHAPDDSNALVPFAPKPKGQPATNFLADDAGRTIIALLQRASEKTKEDSARATDVANRLSFQLHAAEERVRETEAEVAHFRERATRAEAWLLRIHNEAEQLFFQKNEQAPSERTPYVLQPRSSDRPPARNDSRGPELLSGAAHWGAGNMTQTKILWSALGLPTKPGQYRYGMYSFDVSLGDIERAAGNPDAVFTAIHPDFYPSEAPFLLTYVEFPSRVISAAEPQPAY